MRVLGTFLQEINPQPPNRTFCLGGTIVPICRFSLMLLNPLQHVVFIIFESTYRSQSQVSIIESDFKTMSSTNTAAGGKKEGNKDAKKGDNKGEKGGNKGGKKQSACFVGFPMVCLAVVSELIVG